MLYSSYLQKYIIFCKAEDWMSFPWLTKSPVRPQANCHKHLGRPTVKAHLGTPCNL